ncbi:uncharacterized protein TNCV_184241 [Trichonephila clavipes]|nr:uncharacterized protein TNCV_184241 [Trichonephila clavipes]
MNTIQKVSTVTQLDFSEKVETNPDNIGVGSFELKGDKGVANHEEFICESICEEKYTIGTLMGCEKQLTVNRESFRNHTRAEIAGQLNGGKENMCKANVREGLGVGLAMCLPLSESREFYKDSLGTDNMCNIGSKFNSEMDLPGKRDHSTIYRLNLIKLYRRKRELANLVTENSSEEIVKDSEILCSVKLFMNIDFQGILRESQLYFKLPPDRSSYLRMINSKKKEEFPPDPGTIRWRDGQVCPDVGQGIMAPWARRPGCVLETGELERGALPWMEKKEKAQSWIEKQSEESPGWNGLEESAKEKVLVRDRSGKEGKTMNAGGVENRI